KKVLHRLALAFLLPLCVQAAETSSPTSIRLFDGQSLSGWQTLLGPEPNGHQPLGWNKDPRQVFSVVTEDSAPAIRVSGEIFGALVTRSDFENYHLHAQFKWGKLRWPPRQSSVRDSGILYHCVGEPDLNTGWMRSFECQIEEQDCGDFWSVRGAVAFAETKRMDTTDELRRQFAVWCARNEGHYAPYAYWPGGTLTRIDKDGLMKSADGEKPTGSWNSVDIYCLGDKSIHVVNGVTNMVLQNLSQPS